MRTAEMEPPFEQRERLSPGGLVRFVFPYQRLDLRSNQAAYRCSAPSSEDLGLADRFPIEADGKVLLHVYDVYHIKYG